MSSHHRSRDRSPARNRRDDRHESDRYQGKRRDYDRPRSRSPMRRPSNREYTRTRSRSRSRSRSPSRRERHVVPFGQRSTHVDPELHIKQQQARLAAEAETARLAKIKELSNASEQGDESSEMQLMAMMGLPSGGFKTTKFKKVADGNVSGVKLATKRKARQFMNRPDAAGFHKLLPGQGT